jgi:hypothetical protein
MFDFHKSFNRSNFNKTGVVLLFLISSYMNKVTAYEPDHYTHIYRYIPYEPSGSELAFRWIFGLFIVLGTLSLPIWYFLFIKTKTSKETTEITNN